MAFFNFANIGKAIGGAAGVVGGGSSRLEAAGGVSKLQTAIDSKLYSFGQRMGGQVGSSYFTSLSQGAQSGNQKSTTKLLMANVSPMTWGVLAGIGGLLLWAIFRKR